MLEQFVNSMKFPGRLLFSKVWGSRSHNCERPDSDWDYSGVYLVPTVEILGLNHYADHVSRTEGEKPDYAFYEAKRFCELLLTGNPGIVEMIFTYKMCQYTPEWDELRKHSHRFLSKKTVHQYIGYAEGQLKRLKNNKGLHTTGGCFNEKWAYHLTRLLTDAERIVSGEVPLVWKEGKERDHLMSIRNGDITRMDIENYADGMIAKISDKLGDCDLPEKGDEDLLNKWLVDLRMNELARKKS